MIHRARLLVRFVASRPLVAACVVLFGLCAAGWVRSYRVGDELGRLWKWDDPDMRRLRGVSLAHGRGMFRIWIVRIEQEQPATLTCLDEWVYSPHPSPAAIVEGGVRVLGFAGYGWAWAINNDYKSETTTRTSGVILPYWTTLVLLAPPLAVCATALRRWRQAKRWRAAGRCARCGYDLRASSDRCPECGAISVAG